MFPVPNNSPWQERSTNSCTDVEGLVNQRIVWQCSNRPAAVIIIVSAEREVALKPVGIRGGAIRVCCWRTTSINVSYIFSRNSSSTGSRSRCRWYVNVSTGIVTCKCWTTFSRCRRCCVAIHCRDAASDTMVTLQPCRVCNAIRFVRASNGTDCVRLA